MNTNEVLDICKQLVSEGKQPSVALVKTRMTGPKVLPLIIDGIKQFSANPNTEAETQVADVQVTLSDTQRISALELETAALKEQLQELKAEMKKLTS